ncbi:hypothetical protein [Actinomyces sp. MRS3W]|uniref:hypothetical protein n=1 Tax=Actinomyces sp. MRS3W TaxID=2800796 RepID=UPI0028FD9303|nr:hypothetical protein [Actinomyces sp. MRS3W]MDU0349722.1 hypothetical protein [Actinomyces sp. MRS3W]
MKFDRYMVLSFLMSLLLVVSTCIVVTPAAWANKKQDRNYSSSSGSVSEGSDGSVTVSVSAEFVSAAADGAGGGASVASLQTVAVTVHPVCWFEQDRTGAEVAEWFESGRAEKEANTYGGWGDPLSIVEGMYPDYESYADDTEGYWYTPWCSLEYFSGDDFSEFNEISGEFYASNGPVYVPAGQAAPEAVIDGATLARAAWDAITIPTATIGYNPTVGERRATIVGMDTWIWATGDTPSQVTVTATAGSTTATVIAAAGGLDLEPTDGEAFCTGFGVPWTEQNDRVGTDCVIVFDRSSAHLEGSVTPVEVSVGYAASYTASDGATGFLGTHTTETTTTIPVAEIQTLNTRPTKQP